MTDPREYGDMDNNPVSLDKLCRTEPEWAASRIRVMEAEAARLREELSLCDSRNEELQGMWDALGDLRAEIAKAIALTPASPREPTVRGRTDTESEIAEWLDSESLRLAKLGWAEPSASAALTARDIRAKKYLNRDGGND